jgi:hypothetical protein
VAASIEPGEITQMKKANTVILIATFRQIQKIPKKKKIK